MKYTEKCYIALDVEKEIVQLREIITSDALLKRWIGMDLFDLKNLLFDGALAPYQYQKTHKDPDGVDIHFCAAKVSPGTVLGGLPQGLVFDMVETNAYEQAHPECMWPVAVLPDSGNDMSNHGAATSKPAPMVGVEAEGTGQDKPTKSIIQRLKDGGETNKQIAARYPDFFGYDKSNTTADHWARVYGRLKAFMRGMYKGSHRS